MRHLNKRRYYTVLAALAAVALMAVLSTFGPWSPRVVTRDDPAGKAITLVELAPNTAQ